MSAPLGIDATIIIAVQPKIFADVPAYSMIPATCFELLNVLLHLKQGSRLTLQNKP